MLPLYLDYAATTPVDPRVVEAMQACYTLEGGCFGNAASSHFYGKKAHALVEVARAQVAAYLHAEPSEIIWTSGATESNNLALKGVAHLYQRKGRHLITMKTEHKSVLDSCQQLEKEGYEVTYLAPQANGVLCLEQLATAIRPDTILVSIMHINNETGVLQDIAAIAALVSSHQILFHVDAAQSVGKIALNVQQLPIDLISLSAHKAYGPKGIGALYLRKRPRVRVQPLLHGGGQEQGMRSGTLATPQIVGMGVAFDVAQQEEKNLFERLLHYRALFLSTLSALPALRYHVDFQHAVPHIVNFRFEGMIADAILAALPQLAASTASACQGKGTEGSYVLAAMGLTSEQIKSALRFSWGRYTSEEDVLKAATQIRQLFFR